MALVIVQLSDMHVSISKGSNPLLERGPALCGAIRSQLNPSDYCVLVFSGDVADRGKAGEYDLALKFINDLVSELSSHIHKTPFVIIVPGNHDLDFDLPEFDEKLREVIIDNSSPKNPPNDAMNEYCFKPQLPFREFAHKLSEKGNAFACCDIVESQLCKFDSTTVRFHLLNTTRFTRREEVPGSFWFPTDSLSERLNIDDEAGTITVGVLHHPYNWHRPENAGELRRLLESHCDILFTGHEHFADNYKKTRRTTEQNLYIEGGILQNYDDAANSSFNIIRLDSARQTFLCTAFCWSGSVYEELTEPYEHRYLCLRQSLMNEFELQEQWGTWLDQVGTDFRHPRCRELRLSDLFVYPDLQRLNVKKACSPAGLVRDRDLVGFIQEKKRVFIAGSEKTGKTSLSKKLFTDLREAGYVPLLIRSDFSIDKHVETAIGDRIRQSLDRVLHRVYTASSATRFWQTKIEERALIVDDYHRLSVGRGGRDALVNWFDENFGIVILIATPGTRISDILNRTEQDTLLWTFEHVDILEADAESRYGLVRNWLLAGTDTYQVSLDTLYKDTIRHGQVIDGLIGQGAVPSLPLFIFMMMQQLETRGNVESATGLYGSLYELIIRDVVKGASHNPTDVEVKLNYLSELAYALYSNNKRFFYEEAFFKWHDGYCEAFNRRLNSEQMILQFESIGVFRRLETEIGFKYRYYYCFFLARHIAQNIHEDYAIKIVEQLCSTLHNVDAGNTMLFLCHMSKDPRILKLMLENAKSHFRAVSEYDLSKSPSILPNGMIQPERLVLSTNSPEEERLTALRHRDEVDRPHGLAELDKNEMPDREPDRVLTLVNECNAAFQSIRICGQVLRNFYGGMKGDVQIEVIRECYGVCLRIISAVFEVLERDKETLAAELTKILAHRYPKMGEDELDKNVRRFIHSIALGISYGLVKHTSNSLGLADLKPSFDKLISSAGVTVSHRLIDLSIRLDYFEAFPEPSVMEIAADLDGGVIGHEMLRVLVWEHFKLYDCDFRLRQRICDRLKIEANQPLLILQKDKRLPKK